MSFVTLRSDYMITFNFIKKWDLANDCFQEVGAVMLSHDGNINYII